jgi:hypothetical protein
MDLKTIGIPSLAVKKKQARRRGAKKSGKEELDPWGLKVE